MYSVTLQWHTQSSWYANALDQFAVQTRRGEEGAVASKDLSSFIKGASGSLFEVLLCAVFEETSRFFSRSERSPLLLLIKMAAFYFALFNVAQTRGVMDPDPWDPRVWSCANFDSEP